MVMQLFARGFRCLSTAPSQVKLFNSMLTIYSKCVSQSRRYKVAVEVQEVKQRKAKPALEGLRFGTAFTDHMLMMEWTEVGGWQAPRIVPQGPLAIHPGATVLQYAQV